MSRLTVVAVMSSLVLGFAVGAIGATCVIRQTYVSPQHAVVANLNAHAALLLSRDGAELTQEEINSRAVDQLDLATMNAAFLFDQIEAADERARIVDLFQKIEQAPSIRSNRNSIGISATAARRCILESHENAVEAAECARGSARSSPGS